jgi:hypothetical protein
MHQREKANPHRRTIYLSNVAVNLAIVISNFHHSGVLVIINCD